MITYTVTPFFNETSRFEPYTSTDRLKRSVLSFMDVKAETPEQAAERTFTMLNADDRPNGQTERSMSVGDVVMVEWLDFDLLAMKQLMFACEPTGWRKL